MIARTAFVINLDRDRDRWTHMLAEAAKAGLEIERFAAVDGRHLPAAFEPWLGAEETRRKLKPGEIGCYASHLALMKRIADGAAGDAVLILEDDLILPADLVALLDAIEAHLPAGWDIVRLSNPPKRAFVPIAAAAGRELVRYSKIPNNTGAYLISRDGARKFLSAAGARIRAIDEDLRRPWIFGMDTYGVVPAPIKSNIFDSSIDALGDRGLGRRRFKFAMPKESLAGTLARLRYNLLQLGFADWRRCAVLNLVRAVRRGRADRHDPQSLRVAAAAGELARAGHGG